MRVSGTIYVGDNPRNWDRLYPIGIFTTSDVPSEASEELGQQYADKGINKDLLVAGVATPAGDLLGVMSDFCFYQSKKMINFIVKPAFGTHRDSEIRLLFDTSALQLYCEKEFTKVGLRLDSWRGAVVLAIVDGGKIAAYHTLEESVSPPKDAVYYIMSIILGSYWLLREAAKLQEEK